MTGDRIVAGDEAEFVGGACSCKSGGPSKLPSRLRASTVNKPRHFKLRTEKKKANALPQRTQSSQRRERQRLYHRGSRGAVEGPENAEICRGKRKPRPGHTLRASSARESDQFSVVSYKFRRREPKSTDMSVCAAEAEESLEPGEAHGARR